MTPKYRNNLPQLGDTLFACYTGMETELVFRDGIDLPGFAAYPLLRDPAHALLIRAYYQKLIDLAREHNIGVFLDSTTWVANRDRAAQLGFTPEELIFFNQQAIEFIEQVRQDNPDVTSVLCAQIGPRGDGYAPQERMSLTEAERYHTEQISVYAATNADIVSAFTLCYPEEAAGIVSAAKQFDLPVSIAFTVETDGHLPTGMPLEEAIEYVDRETKGGPLYYLINCAHPDHLEQTFNDRPWVSRIKGVVANASRCSHAELDEAETIDEGNPQELGKQIAQLKQRFPHFNVLGGCCGTDMRHMHQIFTEVRSTR